VIITFLAFEFIEHVAFPLFWSLVHRKEKTPYGPGRILGERGEVKEWKEKEGYVLVDGELWKAVSNVPLKLGDSVVIQKMEGLTVTVYLANPMKVRKCKFFPK
jgi:membrane-bound serine protease (ClpP class)